MSNPLLTAAGRPFGLPDFTALTVDHYREALLDGMAQQRAQVAEILASDEAPTFDNTVLALETSGQPLMFAIRVFFNLVSSDSTPALRDLEEELAPQLAAHEDSIMLDPVLFARVDAVHSQLDELEVDEESKRLVEVTWQRMHLGGASLDADDKQRLMDINQRLSLLNTTYQKRVLEEANDAAILFASAQELDGLDDDQLASCRQAAQERGLDGYLVTHMLFTDHPYQAQLTNRESRRRIHQASVTRGMRDNEFNVNDLVREIVTLRAERARLLGFEHFADAALADQTIGGAQRVEELVYPLAGPALANVRREAAALQAFIDQKQAEAGEPGYELQPWDWSYWTERLRTERHAIDASVLRDHFELDRVLIDGVFWAATQLYGITFNERADITTYHPDARAFEVTDADGSTIGLFIHDPFTRDSKRGGAWMNNLVEQNTLFDELPVVVNNLNIPKPAPGRPALLTLDEVTTMFHEFGHALHGLLSHCRYPSLAGLNVPRDFVEFPSQVNEMWITWPEVVRHYARHHETGEPLDQSILDAMQASSTFNEGFATTEYLAAALLDQEWHKIAPGTVIDDVQAFEDAALERVGLKNPWVVSRYRSTYFTHVFSGGYAAGYYGYIHAEILDADTVEWFRENGGLTRANGDVFRRELLSRGNTREPMASFEAVRGRAADIAPLLKRRGLA